MQRMNWMAQYRQPSGFDDYVSTSSSNNHHYSNGGISAAVAGTSDHVSIGVRATSHKQTRHHRRLGHSAKRRISIGTVISLLCFVLAASAFAYVFLSRDHSSGYLLLISLIWFDFFFVLVLIWCAWSCIGLICVFLLLLLLDWSLLD